MKCKNLKHDLKKDFKSIGFELNISEIVYEENPDNAMEVADKLGLDDIPACSVNGIVFKIGYGLDDVELAAKC